MHAQVFLVRIFVVDSLRLGQLSNSYLNEYIMTYDPASYAMFRWMGASSGALFALFMKRYTCGSNFRDIGANGSKSFPYF